MRKTFLSSIICILFALTMLLFQGCDKNKIVPTDISLDYSVVYVYENTTEQITVTALPTTFTNGELVVSSSDATRVNVVVSQSNKNIVDVSVEEYDQQNQSNNTVTVTIGLKGYEEIEKTITVNILQTPTTLATPNVDSFSYDASNYTLSWDAIENARSYLLQINGEEISVATNSYVIEEFNSMLSIKIKAIAEVKGTTKVHNDSGYSSTYSFAQLLAPTGLVVNNGVIGWNNNELFSDANNEISYILKINNVLFDNITQNTYSNYSYQADISYSVLVKVVSGKSNIFDSDFSSAFVTKKLSAPTNVTITQNLIQWTAVDYAEGYQVKIQRLNDETWELVSTTDVSATRFAIPQDILSGQYKISVATKGNGKTTLTGNYGAELPVTKLSAPQNLRVESGKLVWDDNASATGYKLSINEIEYPIHRVVGEEINEFSLMGNKFPAGIFDIKILSLGNGTDDLDSSYSNTITKSKLATPAPYCLNERFEWMAVENASMYSVNFDDLSVYTTTNLYYNPEYNTPISSGEHNMTVYASADGYFNSEKSEVASIEKIAAPSSVRLSNGEVIWDYDNRAIKYILDIAGEKNEVSGVTFYSLDNLAPSSYTIKYRIIGNGSKYISSEFSTGINIVKLNAPTNLRLTNGKMEFDKTGLEGFATGYDVKVENIKDDRVVSSYIDNAEDFAPNGSGTIKLYVRAKGNSGENGNYYSNSSFSAVPLQAKIIAPFDNIAITNGVLEFEMPTGVTRVNKVFLNNSDLQDTTEEITNYNQFDLNNVVAGTHKIIINALGSTGIAGDQNLYILPINGINKEISFTKLISPEEFGVTDTLDSTNNKIPSLLHFTQNGNAVCYELDVVYNDEESNPISTKVTLYPNDLYSSGLYYNYYLGDAFPVKDYKFRIKAMGDGSNYLDSVYSEFTEFSTKVESPTGFKVVNGVMQWDAVTPIPGVVSMSYLVNFNNEYAITTDNFFEIPADRTAGNYSVSIYSMPIGYGLMSKAYKNNVVHKLADPSLKIENQVMSWSASVNATGYKLTINDHEFATLPASQNSLNVKETIMNCDQLPKYGSYKIQLECKGTENSVESNTYFLNSGGEAIYNVAILEPPENITVQDGVLNWNEKFGKEYYELVLRYDDKQETIVVNTNSFAMIGEEFPATDYRIDIRVKGNERGFFTSDYYSTFFSTDGNPKYFLATKLFTVTEDDNTIFINNGRISFKGVDHSSAYKLYLDYELNTENGTITSNSEEMMSDLENAERVNIEGIEYYQYLLGEDYENGNYSVRIQSIGSTSLATGEGINYLSSNISAEHKKLVATKLERVSSVLLEDDVISWTEVPNNGYYIVTINDREYYIQSHNVSLGGTLQPMQGEAHAFNSGDYQINIKARGFSSYLDGNYMEESFAVSKLQKVSDISINKGIIQWTNIPDVPYGFKIDIKSLTTNLETVEYLTASDLSTINDTKGGKNDSHTIYYLPSDFVGPYEIKVTTMGGNTIPEKMAISSDISEKYTLSKLATPINLRIKENTNHLIWEHNPIYNSISVGGNLKSAILEYQIHIINEQTGLEDELSGTTTAHNLMGENFVDLGALKNGNYKIKLRVVSVNPESDLNYFVTSEYSSELRVEMPVAPTGIKLENGKVSWNKVNNVTGYKLDIEYIAGVSNSISNIEYSNKEVITDITTTNNYYYLTKLGKYRVRVSSYISQNMCSDPSEYVGDTSSAGIVYESNNYYLFNLYNGGEGTSAKPFEIANISQLNNVRYNPTAHYKLTESKLNLYNYGTRVSFIPIGTKLNPFTGVFDGQGNEISNLYISEPPRVEGGATSMYIGMFGYVAEGATIKSLTLSNVEIYCGYSVGAVAGYNEGTISSVSVEGKIIPTTRTDGKTEINVGGIAGKNIGSIKYSITSVKVNTETNCKTNYITRAGGVTGFNEGLISECSNLSEYDGVNYTTEVVGTYAGGIAGFNRMSRQTAIIEKCSNRSPIRSESINTGSIINSGYAGGIVGYNDNNSVIFGNAIDNCYNLANITANCSTNPELFNPYVGGIAGLTQNGIFNSYNLGYFTSNSVYAIKGSICGTLVYNINYSVSYCYTSNDEARRTLCGDGTPNDTCKSTLLSNMKGNWLLVELNLYCTEADPWRYDSNKAEVVLYFE